MRRPYYRRPNVPGSDLDAGAANSMQNLRLRILNVMLIGSMSVGLIAAIGNLINYLPRKNWGMVIVTITALLWIVWITIDRKLPYLMRAISFVVLIYMLGAAAQFQNGIPGNSRIWFLGFSVLTAIIIGLKAGIGAVVLSLITMFGSAILVNQHLIRVPEAAPAPAAAGILDWISAGSVWALIVGIVILTSTMLIQGLTTSLDKEKSLSKLLDLDREHMDRRTRELDRRLVQLRTAAEVSRSLSGFLDTDTLLQQVADLMRSRFGLYYVGVYLQDDRGQYAVLRAGSGEVENEIIAEGYRLPIGEESMVGWAIAKRKPRIAVNIAKDSMRENIPLLPQTRSEMALPLISGDLIFGAMTIQSKLPDAFDQDDIIVLQGIADSLATSLQNAALFDASKRNLQDIQALNRQYVVQAWKKSESAADLREAVYENAQNQQVGSLFIKTFPILLRDQVIGQLSLETDKLELTPEEQILVQEVTTQAALAMENIRLLEELQRRASLEHLLSSVAQNVRSQTDIENILRSTISELGKVLEATDGIIYLTPEYLDPNQMAVVSETNAQNDIFGDSSQEHGM